MSDKTVIVLEVVARVTALVVGAILLSGPAVKLWRGCEVLVERRRGRGDASVGEWDGDSIFYRVHSSTLGFLALEYVVLWFTVCVAEDGPRELLDVEGFFGVAWGVLAAAWNLPGLIGLVGLVCATVYGVHQEEPVSRMRVLGAVGACGVLIGLGLRFD